MSATIAQVSLSSSATARQTTAVAAAATSSNSPNVATRDATTITSPSTGEPQTSQPSSTSSLSRTTTATTLQQTDGSTTSSSALSNSYTPQRTSTTSTVLDATSTTMTSQAPLTPTSSSLSGSSGTAATSTVSIISLPPSIPIETTTFPTDSYSSAVTVYPPLPPRAETATLATTAPVYSATYASTQTPTPDPTSGMYKSTNNTPMIAGCSAGAFALLVLLLGCLMLRRRHRQRRQNGGVRRKLGGSATKHNPLLQIHKAPGASATALNVQEEHEEIKVEVQQQKTAPKNNVPNQASGSSTLTSSEPPAELHRSSSQHRQSAASTIGPAGKRPGRLSGTSTLRTFIPGSSPELINGTAALHMFLPPEAHAQNRARLQSSNGLRYSASPGGTPPAPTAQSPTRLSVHETAPPPAYETLPPNASGSLGPSSARRSISGRPPIVVLAHGIPGPDGFVPTAPDEIPVHNGDQCVLLHRYSDGWCRIRNITANGLVGMVPTQFVVDDKDKSSDRGGPAGGPSELPRDVKRGYADPYRPQS
ncbi:hypothetical protein HDU90_005211 [Geranomyces variabilis]|nr:hypothetical protein HDU90_005211 [Geranomyces variabilis]